MFELHLLGGFRLAQNGTPIASVSSQKQQALLAYLALHRNTPHARRHLSFLFWPDSSEKQARTNLRNLLHQLRSSFPDIERLLSFNTKNIQWRTDATCKLDVAEFESALGQVEAAGENGQRIQEALERAVALYAGDLLPGFYDDWLLGVQESLRVHFLHALDRLIVLLEDQRDYVRAIQYAVKLLHHEPLSEETYRRLMRLHALNQDRASAVSVYTKCVEVLQRELGIPPSIETLDLYQRLLDQQQKPRQPGHAHHSPAGQFRAMSAAPSVTITPLVGRQAAWQQLLTCWRSATQGKAQFVLISGEAGIGKTRLVEELMAWTARQGISSAIARCYAVEDSLSYGPVVAWLRSDPLQRRLPDLDQVWQIELARLLPELHKLGMPAPDPLTQGWQRQRLFDAVAQAVMAVRPPLLLVLDDIQWCDAETLEWLHYLLRTAGQARVLVAATLRSEENHADYPLTTWLHALQRHDVLSEIALGPLDQEETAQLANLIAGETLDADVNDRLYHETEGHPLFVVEVTRAGPHLVRSLPPPSWSPELPASWPVAMQLVIESRLNQLSSASRELINLAAVIGRRFTVDVLAAAGSVADHVLADGLDEALQRRLIREQGPDGYDFSHDRLREVAYTRLNQVRRRLLHRQVAEALEAVFADRLDDICSQLAVHCERAGLVEKAIGYYRQAAEAALRLYAHQDAVHLLTSALHVLEPLPHTAARDQLELGLCMMMGKVLLVARGFASPEVEQTYTRAWKLAQKLDDPSQRYPALWGFWAFYSTIGDMQKSIEVGRQLLDLAQTGEDEEQLLQAWRALGATYYQMGDFTRAREQYSQAIHLYDPSRHANQTSGYGMNAGVACLSIAAPTWWMLGYPEQALAYCHKSLALADELSDPASTGFALNYAASFHQFRGDSESSLSCSQTSIDLCSKYGYEQLLGSAMVLHGWAVAAQGEVKAGIAQIEQGVHRWRATGAEVFTPYFLFLLADANSMAGNVEKAFALLAEALTAMWERDERRGEPELHQLQGDLFLRQGDVDIAETCYQQALQVARLQQAKSLELRVALRLSRLWQQKSRSQQSLHLLADVYGWFTEGFDTPDLQEARKLLNVLE